jgi:hypothetical protein
MSARWSSVDKRPFLVNPRRSSLLEHRAATALALASGEYEV